VEQGEPSAPGRLPGLAWRLSQDRQLEAVRPLNDRIDKSTDDPEALCQPKS
jgi:hypothetical protein